MPIPRDDAPATRVADRSGRRMLVFAIDQGLPNSAVANGDTVSLRVLNVVKAFEKRFDTYVLLAGSPKTRFLAASVPNDPNESADKVTVGKPEVTAEHYRRLPADLADPLDEFCERHGYPQPCVHSDGEPAAIP